MDAGGGQGKEEEELSKGGELGDDGRAVLHACEDEYEDHESPLPTSAAESLQAVGKQEDALRGEASQGDVLSTRTKTRDSEESGEKQFQQQGLGAHGYLD